MQAVYLMSLICGNKWMLAKWVPHCLQLLCSAAILGWGMCRKKDCKERAFCLGAESKQSSEWWHFLILALREFPQELVTFLCFPLVSCLALGHRHLLIFSSPFSFIFLFARLFISFLISVYLEPPKLPSRLTLPGAASALEAPAGIGP